MPLLQLQLQQNTMVPIDVGGLICPFGSQILPWSSKGEIHLRIQRTPWVLLKQSCKQSLITQAGPKYDLVFWTSEHANLCCLSYPGKGGFGHGWAQSIQCPCCNGHVRIIFHGILCRCFAKGRQPSAVNNGESKKGQLAMYSTLWAHLLVSLFCQPHSVDLYTPHGKFACNVCITYQVSKHFCTLFVQPFLGIFLL